MPLNLTSEEKLEAVLWFWFKLGFDRQDWFGVDKEFDETCKFLFEKGYRAVCNNQFPEWRNSARGCMAEIIVCDQLPRNMFRGTAEAYGSDARAREVLNIMLEKGWDKELEPIMREFAYLPMEHWEDPKGQEKSVALFTELGAPVSLQFAQKHKVIIDRFGRYPQRNAALGRESTDAEKEFLAHPDIVFKYEEHVEQKKEDVDVARNMLS